MTNTTGTPRKRSDSTSRIGAAETTTKAGADVAAAPEAPATARPTRARVPAPPAAKSATAPRTASAAPDTSSAATSTAPAQGRKSTAAQAPAAAAAPPEAPQLKKRELVDAVVRRTGLKKRHAKPAVEAALAILGETLAEGRELNLQPLGKVLLNRTQESDTTRVMVTRIRQSKAAAGEQTPAKSDVAGGGKAHTSED